MRYFLTVSRPLRADTMLPKVHFFHHHPPLPLLLIRYIQRELFIHPLFDGTHLTHYIINTYSQLIPVIFGEAKFCCISTIIGLI